MFVKPIEEAEATGRVAEIYQAQKAQLGFVMSTAKSFTPRPDLLPIYTEFSDRIRGGFSLGMRAWRLITLIAAKHVPSTYCSYVYGKQLVGDLGSKDAVLAVQRDFRRAGLSDKEIEMLAYAEKIAKDASQVSQADIDRLRAVGFTDHEICDIALRLIPLLRQPFLRRHGRRAGGSLHRWRRDIPHADDGGPEVLSGAGIIWT